MKKNNFDYEERDNKILAEFYKRRGNITMVELGKKFKLSASSVSSAIDRARQRNKSNRLIANK